MMMLDPKHMFSYVTFDIRYSRLSRTWRTPKLCHSATLETTSEGIVEFRDVCVCIAWRLLVV